MQDVKETSQQIQNIQWQIATHVRKLTCYNIIEIIYSVREKKLVLRDSRISVSCSPLHFFYKQLLLFLHFALNITQLFWKKTLPKNCLLFVYLCKIIRGWIVYFHLKLKKKDSLCPFIRSTSFFNDSLNGKFFSATVN